MRRVSVAALAVSPLALSLISASALAFHYRVRLGDTLSQIAKKNVSGPVYGSRGSLKKIIALNSSEIERSDLIFPGQLLLISSSEDKNSKPVADNSTAVLPSADRKIASVQNDSNHTNPEHRADLDSSQTTSVTDRVKAGSIELIPSFGFTHLNVQDKTSGAVASIYSKSKIGVDAKWNHTFSPQWSGYAQAGFAHYSLSSPPSVATLSDTSPTSWNFEAGVTRSLSDRFSLSFGLGYGQFLSLSGLSASSLSVDLVRIPQVNVGANYAFYKDEDFESGVKATAGLLLPGSTDTYSSGMGTSDALLLYAKEPSSKFWAAAGANYTNFGTAISSSQETSFVFQIGIEFDLTHKKRARSNAGGEVNP